MGSVGYSGLLQNLGFVVDPFAKTNADEEELLRSYFIDPPFFKAVYGDLSTMKSAGVFAPRGGGKTALKRMLEVSSLSDNFLCATYNQFGVAGKSGNGNTLHRAGQSLGERLLRELQREAAG